MRSGGGARGRRSTRRPRRYGQCSDSASAGAVPPVLALRSWGALKRGRELRAFVLGGQLCALGQRHGDASYTDLQGDAGEELGEAVAQWWRAHLAAAALPDSCA